MKKFAVLALLALSLITLAAPAAQANVPDRADRHAALVFARYYWTVTRGEDQVCYRTPLRFHAMESRYYGYVYHGSCTIHLNRAKNWNSWWKLCSVVTHEMGHTQGHTHTSRYDRIMYAYSPNPAWGWHFEGCRY